MLLNKNLKFYATIQSLKYIIFYYIILYSNLDYSNNKFKKTLHTSFCSKSK